MTQKNILTKLNKLYVGTKGGDTYQCINNAILNFWDDIHNETIVGIGYTPLYLKNFIHSNNTIIAATTFGPTTHYKTLKSSITSSTSDFNKETTVIDCAIQNDLLPFVDNSINRVLLIHALEYSDNVNQMLREIWRILIPEGQLLIVVPNKFNILSYIEKDLFKNCRSFTIRQLYNLLYDHMFMPVNTSSALFGIPNFYSTLSPLTNILENTGNKSLLPFGGILLIESTKLIYASNKCNFKHKIKKSLFPARKLTSPYNRRT